jgi:hypothetical protein
MTNPSAIEADIAQTRAELRQTVDELSDRLNPSSLAQEAMEEAKIAAADLKRRATGEVRGPVDPEPSTTGWVILGTGAALGLAIVTKILRKL